MVEDVCLCDVLCINYKSSCLLQLFSVCIPGSTTALYLFTLLLSIQNFPRFCLIHLRIGTASSLLYEFCTHHQITQKFKLPSPVTMHVLLDVQKAVEVLASECSLSHLMLTTYCLKAIGIAVPCCAYPEVDSLSLMITHCMQFPLSGCEMLPFSLYRTEGIAVVRTSFKSAVLC